MTNEYAKAELASVLEEVQQQFRSIAQIQQARVELTASATVRKRVTVTVNADGTIIETKFGPGIEELSFSDIAKAVTEAAQQASTELSRKTKELMAPLEERRARLPKISDLVEGMPDFSAQRPVAPPVPLAPPDAREQRAEDDLAPPMEFDNVEVLVPERNPGVTNSDW